MLMTKRALQDICKEHSLYRTASLNDKLYCNFKGFVNIDNLDDYTNLRALFLEGNAIDSLHGIPQLKELRCLYLQQNLLTNIGDLKPLENLDTINISNNRVASLNNLSCCQNLKTLIAANNDFKTVESIQELSQCQGLHTVDLQNNHIEDPAIVDVLQKLPDLRCLYLKGNPVVSNIKNYRKFLISTITTLTYLDDRPVFEAERRTSEAWARGGLEAEREERQKVKDEEEEKRRSNFQMMQNIRQKGIADRRKKLGLPEGTADPSLDEFSDDEWVPQEDPPELVEARLRLAAYTYRENEEEPAELAEARRQQVRQNVPIQKGEWAAPDPVVRGFDLVDASASIQAVSKLEAGAEGTAGAKVVSAADVEVVLAQETAGHVAHAVSDLDDIE